MKDLYAPFSAFVQQLIMKELSETQQEQFSIEGEEIIQSLFNNKPEPDYDSDGDFAFDFGIAASALDVRTVGVTFIDIIYCCFSLIENGFQNKTASTGGPYMEPSSWKQLLAEKQAHQPLVELLCGPYSDQLKNILKLI